MDAQWIAACAAVFVALVQVGMAFLVLQIRNNIHSALEQFRKWVEETFETKEVAAIREQALRQRLEDRK